MISLFAIANKLLTETMSFADLWRKSDPARKDRAKHVHAKSLTSPGHVRPRPLSVNSSSEEDVWMFSYKSEPSWSTTKRRWHGYVRFLKESANTAQSAKDLQCIVDCDCPDYTYRWAYNNAEVGAGAIGPGAWNQNNGQPPRPKELGGVGDLGEGLCKHLIGLGEYLKTKIEPTAPEPPQAITAPITPKPVATKPKPVVTKPVKPLQPMKPIGSAPEPPKSGYADTRAGEIMEAQNSLYNRIENFVRSNPTFEVIYDDAEK